VARLSAKRDAEAAKRFFRKALAQPHTVNPRTITVDKNAAYPKATAEMKKDGERRLRGEPGPLADDPRPKRRPG
jgi:transposase-like protein